MILRITHNGRRFKQHSLLLLHLRFSSPFFRLLLFFLFFFLKPDLWTPADNDGLYCINCYAEMTGSIICSVPGETIAIIFFMPPMHRENGRYLAVPMALCVRGELQKSINFHNIPSWPPHLLVFLCLLCALHECLV